jgi:hypothetical protein
MSSLRSRWDTVSDGILRWCGKNGVACCSCPFGYADEDRDVQCAIFLVERGVKELKVGEDGKNGDPASYLCSLS